jgi:hypothetical protein
VDYQFQYADIESSSIGKLVTSISDAKVSQPAIAALPAFLPLIILSRMCGFAVVAVWRT